MKNDGVLELPSQLSGYNSTFPLKGAWVPSLVGELRFCMPCNEAQSKQINDKVLLHATICIKLEKIMLRNQTQKSIYCMISFI